MRSDLYELPFDQFQRYKVVHDLADCIKPPDGGRLKVLDVGGYPGLIADFLPDDDVTVVDVIPADLPNYVQASGARLPFEDASFDLVCTCDTLEHVQREDRTSFIAELARVARDFIVMTAPFADERTRLAEEILYSYVMKVLRTDFVTLREHLDNGLPDLAQTIEWFKEVGVAADSFASGHLYNWLPMMIAKHHLMAHHGTEELHKRLDKFYNLSFSDGDHREPSYRRVIVGSKTGDPRAAAFCGGYRTAADGGAASFPDQAKLDMFKLLAELLDMDLRRNVSELVIELKESVRGELAELRAGVLERDRQIGELNNELRAKNESMDELHRLLAEARGFLPYQIYAKLFKRK